LQTCAQFMKAGNFIRRPFLFAARNMIVEWWARVTGFTLMWNGWYEEWEFVVMWKLRKWNNPVHRGDFWSVKQKHIRLVLIPDQTSLIQANGNDKSSLHQSSEPTRQCKLSRGKPNKTPRASQESMNCLIMRLDEPLSVINWSQCHRIQCHAKLPERSVSDLLRFRSKSNYWMETVMHILGIGEDLSISWKSLRSSFVYRDPQTSNKYFDYQNYTKLELKHLFADLAMEKRGKFHLQNHARLF
jgi:hypothetical protein